MVCLVKRQSVLPNCICLIGGANVIVSMICWALSQYVSMLLLLILINIEIMIQNVTRYIIVLIELFLIAFLSKCL